MAIQEDNKLDPNNKARWGFAGTEGNITVGPQTVGETGGVETARTPVEEQGGRGNGVGGDLEALRGQVETLQEQLQSTSGAAQEAEVLRNQLYALQQEAAEHASEADSLRTQLADLKDQAAASASNGSQESTGPDPRDSLTIAELKDQLDAKGVKYASTLNKAELLDLLKAQPEATE